MTVFGIDVGSVFSSFLTSGDPAAALTNAQLQLENRVGQFLTTGQRVADAKTRADALRNATNQTVKDRAVTLSNTASALLDTYGSLKTDATALINKMVDLKNQVNANPDQFAQTNQESYGWRVMDVLTQNKNAVLQAASDSVTFIRRLDSYTDQVTALENDVTNLYNISQGKGVSGVLNTLGGTLQSNYTNTMILGGLTVIAVVYAYRKAGG